MKRYTLYCTESQTRKALELGAPIEKRTSIHINGSLVPIVKDDFLTAYIAPTAEQMIGWLEEQGRIKEIAIFRDSHTWTYIIIIDGRSHVLCEKFESRKQATLAAIDAALEYLTNNKK